MLANCFLNFGWVHVETRNDNQIFGAVHQIEKSIIVNDGDIAGSQPAIVGQRPCRGLWVFEIAEKHVRPTHPDFSGITTQGVFATFINKTHFNARQHAAD